MAPLHHFLLPYPTLNLPLVQALKFSGRILVAHESFEPGHYGELYDTWEEIEHPDAVQTPAEVSLQGVPLQAEHMKWWHRPNRLPRALPSLPPPS